MKTPNEVKINIKPSGNNHHSMAYHFIKVTSFEFTGPWLHIIGTVSWNYGDKETLENRIFPESSIKSISILA